MFEYQLMERARADRKHIVLPESTDDRILEAAAILLRRGVADLTLLGEETKVRARASALGLDLDEAKVISPLDPELVERFAADVRGGPGAQGDDARAGPRGGHRHLLLRHDDGAPRAGRRHGLRGGEHHGAHHPAGAGVRQDQARGEHGVQRLPDVPGRPGAGLRRLRGDPGADHRAAGRHRGVLGRDGPAVRDRAAGGDAVLLDRRVRIRRGRGEGAGGDRPGRRAGAATWRWRDRSSTTRRSTPTWPGPSCRTPPWPVGRRCSSSRT